jgi:hypothetical protein
MKSNHYITVMCNAKMLYYTLLGITWKKCNITITLQLHITSQDLVYLLVLKSIQRNSIDHGI